MSQALYRKYRSRSLDEIVGQQHIVQTLKKALITGSISHAYLFTGPRGTGKTSVARILAHAVNQLEYDDERQNVDIIEIDAASNRRIDEIRNLRDTINIAPSYTQYKVYIIDEVHMLTKEAFNALLKTLEEPPQHVVFILATTDIQKVPETIISRTQRYTFRPIPKDDMVKHLQSIAKTEGFSISTDAIDIISEHSNGSLRDAESLLDQASNYPGKISPEQVLDMLGIPAKDAINRLTDYFMGPSAVATQTTSIADLQALLQQGYSAASLAAALSQEIRSRIIRGEQQINDSTLAILEDLLTVSDSSDPDHKLELVLLRAQTARYAPPAQADTEDKPLKPPVAVPNAATPVIPADRPSQLPPPTAMTETKIVTNSDEIWSELLNMLKKKHNTVYGIIRMATPEITESTITIRFKFAFHQKQINEQKNRQIISDILHTITGKHLTLTCLLIEKDEPTVVASNAPKTSAELSAIANIFGDVELTD